MVGLTISQARAGFFDRPAVIRAVGKAKAAVLSKFGAYVRRSARTLIRPAGKKGAVSRPGEPPRAHVGHLRNRISFAWDLRSQSEVIGPEKFNQNFVEGYGKPVKGVVPQILEQGGQISIIELRYPGGPWYRASLRRARSGRVAQYRQDKRRRVATIAPRPYMGPALQANVHLLPPMWANSLRPAG